MKIRNGFVSNSSSSSYVVVGTRTPPHVHFKLPNELGQLVLDEIFEDEGVIIQEGESVYVTEHLSDTNIVEAFGDGWENKNIRKEYRKISELHDGGHGGLYSHDDPDFFVLKQATEFYESRDGGRKPMNAVYLHKRFFRRLIEKKQLEEDGTDMFLDVLKELLRNEN